MALNFTPDNTPPDGISAVAAAPDNGAPAGKSAVAGAPDNTAPDGKSAIAAAPDNTAPDGKSAIAGAPDNTLPDGKAAVAAAPNNAAPDAKAAAAAAPGGVAPDSLDANTVPVNEPPLPMPGGPLSAPTDNNVNTPPLSLDGELVLNRIYGWAKLPSNQTLVRVQVQLNEPPVGAAAKLALVDSNGDPLGVEVTVPDGQKFGETVVAAGGLALLAGANVRAKCTQIGSGDGTPGGFGAVTLFFQLTA